MSEDFFDQLNIPKPHINLGVGSGTQATQTDKIMLGYENAIREWKPELCIVVGDVRYFSQKRVGKSSSCGRRNQK